MLAINFVLTVIFYISIVTFKIQLHGNKVFLNEIGCQ